MIRRRVFVVALPYVIESLFESMMFYADMLMLGRLRGEEQEAIAALGVAGPIVFTVITILLAVRVGIIATVARAVGEGDEEKKQRTAWTGLLAALGIGVVASAAGYFALPHMTALFRVPQGSRAVELAFDYVRVIGAALFFQLLMVGATAIMRAAGNTRTPMAIGIAANLLNIALNYLLIFGHHGFPKLGVVGAAAATAVSHGFYGAVAAALLFTRFGGIRLRLRSAAMATRESLASLGRVALPAMLEPIVLQSGFFVYSMIVAALGQMQLAAHRTGIAIESLTFMPGNAMAIACGALAGQALGARKPEQAEMVFHEASRIALYFMSAVGVALLLFGIPLSRLFIPHDDEVVHTTALCLAIVAFSEPFFSTSLILGGALRGAGDTRSPVWAAFVGTWLVRVPCSYLLGFTAGLGIYGIWITMNLDWFVRMWLLLWIFRRGRWKEVRL
jgi:putative MATE family efflux protein